MSAPARSITVVPAMKDTGDSTPKDEKAEPVIPALSSQPVQHHLSRRATVYRMGRIAVRRPRWRRLFYALFGIGLISVWVGITVGFANSETKNQDKNAKGADDFTQASGTRHRGQGYFLLEGELVEFDADQRELTVSWSGLYLKDSHKEPFGTSDASSFSIGLYVNEKVVYNNSDTVYEMRLANATALPIGVFTNPWQNYDTGIDMGQESSENAWRQPEYGFPFDQWTGSITFGATFRDCFPSTTIYPNVTESNQCATSWDYAYLTGSIINWKFNLTLNNTCNIANGTDCNMILTVDATRSGLVIFACIVAVVVNWLSTIFIFVMTMEGVVMQHFQVIEGPQLLAVCFTALFALPSVRSILPGAPEFGALIDLVGIVPNVIIISLCTTMVAIATLRKLIHKNNEKGEALAAAVAAEPV